MAQEYLEVANSPHLWAAAALCVGLVLIQALLFMRRAWKTGKQMGMPEEQMKSGVRSGAISAIGPAIAVLFGMVALLSVMGGPISWLRLSFIGSIMFELMAAQFGVSAVGQSFDPGEMTAIAFTNAVWIMTIGAIGWILVTGFFTPQMETARQKMAGGKEKLVPIIGAAAMLGAFAQLAGDYVVQTNTASIAVISGGISMFVLLTIADRTGVTWLREWALGIAMFAGVFVPMIINSGVTG